MSSSLVETQAPAVRDVRVTPRVLEVVLQDGRMLSVPLDWYPRLAHGSASERREWRVIAGGVGIHWPQLDEDISVAGLLAGLPSGESDASLNRWLASRHRPPNKALQPTSRARRKAKSKKRSRSARG
jgi:hypothetical protein